LSCARGADSATVVERLREIASSVDPDLRVSPIPLLQVHRQERLALRLTVLVLGLIVLSVLLLSAAGVFPWLCYP
jgi:hypothetical protein